jgi:hypothetical protein
MRRLALDAAAVQVVRALRHDGIESILLKGRGIAERLYADEPSARGYIDVDLLVPSERHGQAGRVLAGMGYRDWTEGSRGHERCGYADTWYRASDGVVVDLHRSLYGVPADPAEVWAAMREHTRPLVLGSESLLGQDDVGLALTVVLHAAQHGQHESKPLADLVRALELFDEYTMDQAALIARRLEALPQFVAGLRLVPQGAALATRWGHGVRVPSTTAAWALSRVRGVGTLVLVRAAPFWRRPLVIVQRAYPSRALLRRSMPLARRGPLGLAAAYLLRPVWMAVRLPAALRAWRGAATAWREL